MLDAMTLDLIVTATLSVGLVLGGGAALAALPWTDAEVEQAAAAVRSVARRARAAAGARRDLAEVWVGGGR